MTPTPPTKPTDTAQHVTVAVPPWALPMVQMVAAMGMAMLTAWLTQKGWYVPPPPDAKQG